MINFILNIFKIIFLLGFLILIHEGGHFIVAKLCKVKVIEFAIGFGPIIWKKQGKETKYALRLIPLGGFVNLEGEEEESSDARSFTNASIPKRIAIVVAGAVVNIIFALVVYFLVKAISAENVSTIVDFTMPDFGAEVSGIISGDEIVKINNKKVRTSSDINNIMQKNNGEDITISVKRENEIKDILLKPTAVPKRITGIYLYKDGNKPTQVAGVEPGSAAEEALIKEGDVIIKINDEYVEDSQEKLLELINNSEGNVNLELAREKEKISVILNPKEEISYYIGVQFKMAEDTLKNNLYYAGIDTMDFIKSVIESVKNLFTREVKSAELMGPVGISEVVSKTENIKEYVYILALISMSLGITNLLPFPPLDGGKIVFLLVEAIKGKPVKKEIEIEIQMVGFFILIFLSIYIAYKDVLRIF